MSRRHGSSTDTTGTGRLPRLLRGARRGLLLRLVALAVLQGAAAVGLALAVGALVEGTRPRATTAGLLLVAVAATGATTYGVRVVGERLGQHYVHELRGALVRSAMTTDRAPSLGITVARSTNDLTSVRGWVAQGLPPLVAFVPLLLGATALLGSLSPVVAVAALAPLVVAATVLWVLVPWAYGRARRLRRLRGRLASRLTETLQAREGVLGAGGADRELRRLADASGAVAHAAVERARAAGTLQAVAATAAASIAVLVVATASAVGLTAGAVATALTIAGVLATPLAETGRIAELRQNFRAARRILAPLVAAAAPAAESDLDAERVGPADGSVRVGGVLEARPGDRVHLSGADARAVSAAVRDLASPDPCLPVVVDGWLCGGLHPRRRRGLVGLAATGLPLERGTIARAVRYRAPDDDPAGAARALARVGLTDTVAALGRGERTELRRGGEPLGGDAVARLKLARAAYDDPPLLLLDHIEADLDADGRRVLRRLVDAHPGVVVFASATPDVVAGSWRTVELPAR